MKNEIQTQFFDDYKKCYFNFREKIKVNENKDFTKKEVECFVKKMMAKIVFIKFIQEKGWVNNGDKNYLSNVFDNSRFKDNFFNEVLRKLFCQINIKQEKNSLPYLNCAFFDEEKFDSYNIIFPSSCFKDFFDLFKKYEFSTDEYHEKNENKITPESLSYVFENLLEDNKDKGTFYTPKEIVQYMCEESIIAYLGDTEANRKLVKEFDADDITDKKALLEKLEDVKICDPAIGSGAFPMGMLNILYRIRLILEDKEFTSENIVKVKKEIIQNNIYGVDIEAGAVDIARLRFLLSIVVDEDKPIPLPNLDYKIMQGNSLLEQYNGIDLKLDLRATDKKCKKINTQVIERQMYFVWDDETHAFEKLKAAMNDFFEPEEGADKNKLRNGIDVAVKNYIKTKCGNDPSVNAEVDSMDLNNKPFFLWHLYFADIFVQKGGFDIVIGNPPYGANIDKEINVYRKLYHHVIKSYAEIYKIFFSVGLDLLRSSGILTYITPDTFLTQPRYEDLRKFVLNKKISKIVDLGENVFKEVTVPVCISMLFNQNRDKKYYFLDLKMEYNGDFLTPRYQEIEITSQSIKSFMPSVSSELKLEDVMELKDSGIQYHKHGNRGENTLYDRLFSKDSTHFAAGVPCWYGKLVTPYKIQETDEFFNSEYLNTLDKNESVSFTLSVFEKSPKFLWRQTASRIISAIDFNRKWHRNTLQCGYIKEPFLEEIDPYFLLAVLNSSYLAYCYEMAVRENGRTFPQVRLAFLKPLPMVIPEKDIQKKIKNKVLEIIDADDKKFTIIEQQINEMIFDCFQLSQETRNKVSQFMADSVIQSIKKKKCKKKNGKDAAAVPATPVINDSNNNDDF